MSSSIISNLQQSLTRLLPVTLGLITAVVLGFYLPTDPAFISLTFVGTMVMFLWIVIFPQHWWVALPAGVGFGGFFEFAYKIYPNEIALATAMIPLAISLAIRRRGIAQGRVPLEKVCYALAGYLILHWGGAVYYNHFFEGTGGLGNVLRAYMSAAWGICFICLFNQWGGTFQIRPVLALIYFATWVRVALGLYSYVTGSDGFIPWISYNLQAGDLRFSGLTLAILSVAYFSLSSGFVFKSLHLFIFCLSGAFVLAGSSRSCFVIYLSVPLWLALVNRKYLLLGTLTSLVVAGLVILNLAPSILDGFDPRIARTVSVALIDKNQAENYGRTSSSDYWHLRLREVAIERWTKSTGHLIFGTGIRRFDDSAVNTDLSINLLDRMESTMTASAGVGAYESGLWTVLAVTGAVGLILYSSVLWLGFSACLRALKVAGIASHAHVFAFMGVVLTGAWAVLSWTYGGYPSLEIMYLFLGRIALEDAAGKRSAQPNVSSESTSAEGGLFRARGSQRPSQVGSR